MSAGVEPLPQHIGRYQVERVLGRGAMGTVYLATDPHIQRQVALKTIRTELLLDTQPDGAAAESQLPARFINEARAAGRLVHPHIVGVFDYGEVGGIAYIALEYVRGETLAARLTQHASSATTMPLTRALVWFAQLLDAIGYAHDVGVIHRDIKPANLLIAPRGECKITDFGIAQLDTGRLTQIGMIIGTPTYMSPEQYSGAMIDARSDLYSAGVVLYEMLTGKCPFAGSAASMMHQVINATPAAPSSLVASLPLELNGLILKALAKLPKDRYQSAQQMRVDVLAVLNRLPTHGTNDSIELAHETGQALEPRRPSTNVRVDPANWSQTYLAQIERHLSSYVGPVASRLVRLAAAQSVDYRMLTDRLSRHLTDRAAIDDFHKLVQELDAGSRGATGQPGHETASISNTFTSRGVEAADLERAVGHLATHLGPIARVIVRRAAVGADISTFHARLADALPASANKAAFLEQLKS